MSLTLKIGFEMGLIKKDDRLLRITFTLTLLRLIPRIASRSNKTLLMNKNSEFTKTHIKEWQW